MNSLVLLFALLISAQTFTIAPLQTNADQVPLSTGQIIPGHGYSTDRQSVSSVACFRVKASPYSKSESVVRFDQGSSFSEIQKSLRIDVSVKNGSGMFSVDADIIFMKEIMDTDYSMSINYYQYVQSQLSMDMGYGPAGALTEDGLRVYGTTSNPNPRFGLLCGDKYINSFKVGANLIYSLKLHFQSHTDKTSFETKLGKKFESFMKIAMDIQATAKAVNTSGKVEIMAYQSGGNPADLAKLLNSTCGTDYCAASCSFTNMKDCIGSMNGLLKYSSENFPSQINLQDPKTVSPFSVGFADLQDVKWLGLKAPKSFITNEVVNMRQTLANALLANQYYIDTFTLLAQTKLNWDKDSTLFKTILSIPNEAKLNIQLLMDQMEGGIVCYKSPQTCINDGQEILAKLRPVEAEAKAILEKIKYKIKPDFCGTTFYRISDDKWYTSGPESGCKFFTVSAFTASSTLLSYNMSAVEDNGFHSVSTVGNLIAERQSAPYVGLRHDQWPRNNKTLPTEAAKELSQFAFELYK